jgi:peptidoglycan/LPS O-acetylase OafA/YrhL
MPGGLPCHLDEFGLGMLLALMLEARTASRARSMTAWPLGAGAVALAAVAQLVEHPDVRPEQGDGLPAALYTTVMAAAFALALAALLSARADGAARLLSCRALSALGLVSYGLYLWHDPIGATLHDRGLLVLDRPELYVVNVLVILLPALAVAALSWRLLERPALALKARHPGKVRSTFPGFS